MKTTFCLSFYDIYIFFGESSLSAEYEVWLHLYVVHGPHAGGVLGAAGGELEGSKDHGAQEAQV